MTGTQILDAIADIIKNAFIDLENERANPGVDEVEYFELLALKSEKISTLCNMYVSLDAILSNC